MTLASHVAKGACGLRRHLRRRPQQGQQRGCGSMLFLLGCFVGALLCRFLRPSMFLVNHIASHTAPLMQPLFVGRPSCVSVSLRSVVAAPHTHSSHSWEASHALKGYVLAGGAQGHLLVVVAASLRRHLVWNARRSCATGPPVGMFACAGKLRRPLFVCICSRRFLACVLVPFWMYRLSLCSVPGRAAPPPWVAGPRLAMARVGV